MPAVTHETDVLLRVRGVVQGVGFRPFVHRIANRLALRGWVRNDAQGVLIRAVGPVATVDALVAALKRDAPPAAMVRCVDIEPGCDFVAAGATFEIVSTNVDTAQVETNVPADLALCVECRAELLDPGDRRHRYPFVNCTQCGPRYSIIESLPYDRPRTTMRVFRMCPACEREYGDPADRRFHAEPNACPVCGPKILLAEPTITNGAARPSARPTQDQAITRAAELLARGGVVAVKGIGGYHLLVDATNPAAVETLRRRKHRDEKPFAVLFRDLAAVEAVAEVSAAAALLLRSPAAPVVLVPRRPGAGVAANVAPSNPWIGAFLAYAPLHVLLLRQFDFPVVATSANLAEEPLCTAPEEAESRLAGIADAFVHHDREIVHPVDDSVVRVAQGSPIVLRCARGYAPILLTLPAALDGNWVCVGAHMKNTVAIASNRRLILSPHIGDLVGTPTQAAFRRTIETLSTLHRAPVDRVACDKHPDYVSTRYAQAMGLPLVRVQHHLAHVLACLLEHGHPPHDVLGVSWDGTGYGEDRTVWGGEFLLLEQGRAHRFGRLRRFRLAGGDAAVRDPRRTALGLLHAAQPEVFDGFARESDFAEADSNLLRAMLDRGLNSPVTSSMGRLFDAVGAFLDLGRCNQFEGQTPLAVEVAATGAENPMTLSIPVRSAAANSGAVWELDWEPLVDALLRARARSEIASAALGFHRALAGATVEVARLAGVRSVALTGGCFQNALLLELTSSVLRAAGFSVLTHRELPPNDGNIAVGQAMAALWNLDSVILP